jgi:methionyl-tRNA formyltransferase
VLFLGTPDVAATSLRTIVEDSQKESSGYSVVGVVTQPPKRRKRKGKEIPSPVGYVAEELDIPVLTPEKVRPSFKETMKCHTYS